MEDKIEKWRYRQEVFKLSRFLLMMIFIFSMINTLAISVIDKTPELEDGIFYFNFTILVLIATFITFLDCKQYNIINYGTLTKPKTK